MRVKIISHQQRWELCVNCLTKIRYTQRLFFLNQECFYHVSVDDESHLNQAEKRQMKSSNCLNVSWLLDVLPHHLEAVLHFSSSEDNDRTNLIASIGRPACIKQLAAIESSFAIRRSFPPSFRLNSVNLQLGHFYSSKEMGTVGMIESIMKVGLLGLSFERTLSASSSLWAKRLEERMLQSCNWWHYA